MYTPKICTFKLYEKYKYFEKRNYKKHFDSGAIIKNVLNLI